MISESTLINSANNWQQQASQCVIQGDYYEAANFYEQAIELEPDVKSHYWYLGLILLLQGKEVQAQTTWALVMMEGEPEQVELWCDELTKVLEAEAQKRALKEDNSVAYLLRQHIREIKPTEINNLLYLIEIAIKLEIFTEDDLVNWEVIDLLNSQKLEAVDINLLMQTLQKILDYDSVNESSLEFAKFCFPYLGHSYKYFAVILVAAIDLAYSQARPKLAIEFAQICCQINAEDKELLRHLTAFYEQSGNFNKAIETAKECYSLLENESVAGRVYGNHLLLKTLINAGGYWNEANRFLQRQENLLDSLIEEQPILDDGAEISRVLLSTFFFPYFQDCPQTYRKIQNKLAALCQKNLQNYAEEAEWYQQRQKLIPRKDDSSRRLKIGYISHCFRQHSVGWLARWLFEYHNRELFELYGYLISSQKKADPVQEWYASQFGTVRRMGTETQEIAERIYKDEIDILIDLDSLTLDISCEVMALKPAKIQATWLGWDASGIPAIDYFIADPYVLPDDADNYYSEKIWRLPQTYIAVDGFEVGIPTLRRTDLDIPNDAIVYLSAQSGCKRHPDTVRLQMRILKNVPNSYLLIKGLAEEEAIQNFFHEIANQEGVDSNRLRFLPMVPLEAIHRANLGIADIVLDTYPYNGATTTLETLWMGIPLVTKVGEQFAARNSYTMMMNAGIEEGISWTDEEYIEWGINLGKDAKLRQEVALKLKQSRQTAPLWNGKQFTREMEKAYKQMWTNYISAK
ncbi:MAG: O-linked N-acetylglucosamine transferase, SPINDLY family protein [Rivularia sp. ALOHA_DT_140]|nr:O-linked N-acetylglucosamine transferase, SPINDLY family protein [Rivularia sp. ALOHA_DT_140]